MKQKYTMVVLSIILLLTLSSCAKQETGNPVAANSSSGQEDALPYAQPASLIQYANKLECRYIFNAENELISIELDDKNQVLIVRNASQDKTVLEEKISIPGWQVSGINLACTISDMYYLLLYCESGGETEETSGIKVLIGAKTGFEYLVFDSDFSLQYQCNLLDKTNIDGMEAACQIDKDNLIIASYPKLLKYNYTEEQLSEIEMNYEKREDLSFTCLKKGIGDSQLVFLGNLTDAYDTFFGSIDVSDGDVRIYSNENPRLDKGISVGGHNAFFFDSEIPIEKKSSGEIISLSLDKYNERKISVDNLESTSGCASYDGKFIFTGVFQITDTGQTGYRFRAYNTESKKYEWETFINNDIAEGGISYAAAGLKDYRVIYQVKSNEGSINAYYYDLNEILG